MGPTRSTQMEGWWCPEPTGNLGNLGIPEVVCSSAMVGTDPRHHRTKMQRQREPRIIETGSLPQQGRIRLHPDRLTGSPPNGPPLGIW
jgi:hypothetical protein